MKNSSRGFTLMEMLVYVAIFGVVSVLVVQGMFLVTRAFVDLRISRDINSSATSLIERVTRDIRGAYDIDTTQSILGASPGRLVLNTKDASGVNTTVDFYVDNNTVNVKEGGISQGTVTTSSTQVTNFVVRQIVGTNTKAVRVEATISSTRAGVSRSRNFYTTATLRGTY